MFNWIRKETFENLSVPPKQFFYQFNNLDKDSINERLDLRLHTDIYEFFDLGGEVLFRPNRDGELELQVLINDVDPVTLANSRFGIDNVKIDKNRFEFQFLIFDQEDDPLRLPFIFQLNDDIQRYCAAALCEQKEIPFYFLRRDSKSLIVSFCRLVSWPTKMRQAFRELLIEAYQGNKTNADLDIIKGSVIDEEELTANGWAYQFDLNKLREIHGSENNVNTFIRKSIYDCVQLISNSRYKGVQEGPFLIWMFQREGIFGTSGIVEEALIIVISPFYNDRAPRATRDIEPCFEYLQMIDGFIRIESANPLYENAIPLFRYENGQLESIEMDDYFLETAATIQDNLLAFNGIDRQNHLNIYRHLLESRQKTY